MDRPESDTEEQNSANNEREATELHGYEGEHDTPIDPAVVVGSMERFRSKYKYILAKISFPFQKFWKQQVLVFVPHNACRDHLGTYQTPLHHPKIPCPG